MIKSFPPIVDTHCNTLIPGTMPGEISLKRNQYYGHGGNPFWSILFELYDRKFSKNYDTGVALALKHNIAIMAFTVGDEVDVTLKVAVTR